MTNPDEHFSAEEIARLAEGQLAPESAETMLSHLSQCRSCMAAYVEAVRYRAAWLAAPEAFKPPEELVAAGMRVRFPPSTPGMPNSRAAKWIPAAAALLITALGARWAWLAVNPPIEWPREVTAKLAIESTSGLLLPGVRALPADVGLPRRGADGADGVAPSIDSLNVQFERLKTVHQAGSSSAREAYRFCATQLAAGGTNAASESVAEALRGAPADRDLSVLGAAIAFRQNDLAGAERLLREILERDAGDALVRLDLALVRQARGDTAGASLELEQLARRGDVIGDRARREIGARP
jgi:hypothetical protein